MANINYKQYQPKIQQLTELKGIANIEDFDFRIEMTYFKEEGVFWGVLVIELENGVKLMVKDFNDEIETQLLIKTKTANGN